jgi:hypothetical protein
VRPAHVKGSGPSIRHGHKPSYKDSQFQTQPVKCWPSMLWRVSSRPVRSRLKPAGFILPCQPALADRPPSGPGWLHEIKFDGYRVIARKDVPKSFLGTAAHTAMMVGATCSEANWTYWRPDSRTILTQWRGEFGGGTDVKRRSTVCQKKLSRCSFN